MGYCMMTKPYVQVGLLTTHRPQLSERVGSYVFMDVWCKVEREAERIIFEEIRNRLTVEIERFYR